MQTIGSTIGGLIGGAAGGKSGGASVGSYYPNIFDNSQNYQKLLSGTMGNIDTAQNTAGPALTNTFNTAYNNPYAGSLQQGASTAGNALTNVGTNALNSSTALSGASGSLLPYIQQLLKTGMDPQNALFGQQQQLVRDQSNVTNAQQGLTGPYAAGNVNQNLQNFDINWQNNQLQRALSALSGGGTALGQAGAGMTTANTMGGQGAQDIYAGSGLPYNAAQTITGNQSVDINNLLSGLGNINNMDSQTMQSLLQYLAQGSGYALDQNKSSRDAAAAGASGGSQIGGDIAQLLPIAMSFL